MESFGEIIRKSYIAEEKSKKLTEATEAEDVSAEEEQKDEDLFTEDVEKEI